jgi:hypothetical protein
MWGRAARTAIRAAGTVNHLQQIELALENYCSANGSYPPQYQTDREGRPAHSWRVLILPFLGYQELYECYRFDEPWDGPHNRLLAAEMPEIYRSPFLDPTSVVSQYVGIAGKETPWRGTVPVREEDLPRGESNPLILLVEAANSDINWMEPRDIPLKQALAGINVAGGGGIQSNYSNGLPAQIRPCGHEWVPAGTPSDKLRAMLTISSDSGGGQVRARQ